jgi:hypothetical protein
MASRRGNHDRDDGDGRLTSIFSIFSFLLILSQRSTNSAVNYYKILGFIIGSYSLIESTILIPKSGIIYVRLFTIVDGYSQE